ncbi:hypothetical protein COO20_09825 [Thalassospira marina]|uniref:Uncharacterized protein n=1 Tax=Thalassospira marina TaxID=2048283 RepID=A0A2N3KV60_9PROT|nr:hypothetical protein COO20_09825 [Thalassospira marina]
MQGVFKMADKRETEPIWEKTLAEGPYVAASAVLLAAMSVAISDNTATGMIAFMLAIDAFIHIIAAGFIQIVANIPLGHLNKAAENKDASFKLLAKFFKVTFPMLLLSPVFVSAFVAVKTIHQLPTIGISQHALRLCIPDPGASTTDGNRYDLIQNFNPLANGAKYLAIIDRCKAMVPKPLPDK